MKKVILKLTPIITACILLFVTVGGSAVSAAESLVIQQEKILINELNDKNQEFTLPLEDLRIELENEIEPTALPAIPLLAGLVIRSGATYIAKTTSKKIVKVSDHATRQAVKRQITGAMMDEALSKGTKYVDILSGERIVWLELGPLKQQTAVLLKKNSDEIDTVYDQEWVKNKWIKSNWQFFNDIK